MSSINKYSGDKKDIEKQIDMPKCSDNKQTLC